MKPQPTLNLNQLTGWFIRITCLFWLVAKIICWRLWLSDRLFPLVPPFDFLVAPEYVHQGLFILSLAGLLLLLIFPNKKILQISIIVIEVLSCIFDQNRWQPWEFQYIFTMLIVLLNRKNDNHIISMIVFMLAAIYFYSGVGKFNPMFLRSIWGNLLLSKTFGVSDAVIYQPYVYYSGYLLAIAEIVLGIGLLFKDLRKISLILLVVTHLIILGVFGPFGLNYDHVVWPWNLTMLGFIIILIFKNRNYELTAAPLKLFRNLPILILFGIMPIFSLFGKWDFFLSFSLFSSRPTDMYICMKKDIQSPLNKYCDSSQTPCANDYLLINVRRWSFKEMYVPAYPQTRVYEKIKNKLQNQFPDMQATYFIYTYRNGKKVKEEMK